MNKVFLALCFAFMASIPSHSQDNGIAFGNINTNSFSVNSKLIDDETNAIVLYEFADMYFDTEETFELIIDYHVIIKVLKPEGLKEADISIPLYKNEKAKEKVQQIRAASYTLNAGSINKQSLERKNIYIEDPLKFSEEYKFSIPGVKPGSIIEYQYKLQTPFILNLKTWYFQSHLPKIKSSFIAKIPGNYLYNVSMRGAKELSVNESKIIEDCVILADMGYSGKTGASCLYMHLGMENIPAFKEELYMTSKENFLSSVRFELYQINKFSGGVDKISKSWKDVDDELRTSKDFGLQLKRSRNFFKNLESFKINITKDTLQLAKEIYEKIYTHFNWNDTYGFNAEYGIEKAFEKKTGNVADINLALIAALRDNGIQANPIILATRSRGFVTELYPVLSDFNYVIARVSFGGKTYLLDATSKLPFGIIPLRCLNGKGRVITEKNDSFWEELKPNAKYKSTYSFRFLLNDKSSLNTFATNHFEGYLAIIEKEKRKEFQNLEDYKKEKFKDVADLSINTFEEKNLDNTEPSYSIQYEATSNLGHEESDMVYFNPFLLSESWENPFKLKEREFPVDYGALIDQTEIISFEFPENFTLESYPNRQAKTLPNNGGKMVFECQPQGNKINITFKFLINKPVFNSTEYFYLKELYNTILDLRNTPIVLKRKV